ncbi:MAG: helix-turn-helix transcriptional regulator [Proteobacteria bacterium]|nr:helix-turn-helix transcriptional regulator [Pseudomonadota bacterium]
MDADDVDLIARIYDTALNPGGWPELMLRLAHKLGAVGGFVFEVRLGQQSSQVTSRIFSSNYSTDVVLWYLQKFNAQELIDQARFAELSKAGDSIDLISDIYLHDNVAALLAQPNTAFMVTQGLKHRAGALLNKDLVNVDRFALQFSVDHGPIRPTEIAKAQLFLPHIAKVLGLSRPLEEQLLTKKVFETIVRDIGQGIAILAPRGSILFANTEFERCLQDYRILRRTPQNHLQVVETNERRAECRKFNELLGDFTAHGHFGSRARREALVFELEQPGTALFVEICPIEQSPGMGHLGAGCRLVTVIDTSRQIKCDTNRIRSFYRLSQTETEIIDLVARGHTNIEISEIRNRSQDTIKSQMKSLMRKTNSQNRTDLVHMIQQLSAAVAYSGTGAPEGNPR